MSETGDPRPTAADRGPDGDGSRTVRPLGAPRHHFAEVASTNDVARELAVDGAPHGTTVTATRQTAGRGRQGRAWVVPAGQALTVSVVLRDLPELELLPLAVAVAVAETVGEGARVKWPNDVVFVDAAEGGLRKLAGILCEARPNDGWAVAGIGLNVAVELAALPDEVAARAASMGRGRDELDAVLADLLVRLAATLALTPEALLARWRALDVLRGREVRWSRPGGTDERGSIGGRADGVDAAGNLRVVADDGSLVLLGAGEVHLAVSGREA